jgi:hypothetical protein
MVCYLKLITIRSFLQRRRDPVCYMRPPNLGDRVSRLPKALFRELSGRCSDPEISNLFNTPSRCCSENHQFTPHCPAIGVYPYPVQLTRFRWGLGFLLVRHYRYTNIRLEPNINRDLVPMAIRVLPTRREFRGCYLGNVNDTRRKQIGRKDSPRYLFTEEPKRPTSQESRADTRGFPEGRQGRCEKPDRSRPWNAQRCYRVHPYWTNNLRYVC